MSNVQQPEMRRSGKDALVADSKKGDTQRERSVEELEPAAGKHDRGGPVPPEQQSPYGPHDEG